MVPSNKAQKNDGTSYPLTLDSVIFSSMEEVKQTEPICWSLLEKFVRKETKKEYAEAVELDCIVPINSEKQKEKESG